MTRPQYTRVFRLAGLAYWLSALFIGTRPAFPFVPYGLSALAVVAVGGLAGIRAQRAPGHKLAFFVFSACCLLCAVFVAAEVMAHLQSGDGYYLRPLLTLPLIPFIWYGVWKRYLAWT